MDHSENIENVKLSDPNDFSRNHSPKYNATKLEIVWNPALVDKNEMKSANVIDSPEMEDTKKKSGSNQDITVEFPDLPCIESLTDGQNSNDSKKKSEQAQDTSALGDLQCTETLTGFQASKDSMSELRNHNGRPTAVVFEDLSCLKYMSHCTESINHLLQKNKGLLKQVFYSLLVCGYFTYFGFALNHHFGDEPSIRLLWCTCAVVGIVMIKYAKGRWGQWIYKRIVKSPADFVERHRLIFHVLFCGAVLIFYITFIIVYVAIRRPSNLISLLGIAFYILLVYMLSVNRARVNWRTVLWGLGLQFVFALLVLRTHIGYTVLKWCGDRVSEYISFTDAGARFMFGPNFADHFFAMKAIPVVIVFSATISVLYYCGVMQSVIHCLAWIMQRTMGTTAAESVSATGNIFLGLQECPLLIKPFIEKMTKSELHAVLVGGYATIAGSIMATYILLGVPANHLISASIMAAPCSLALSKLCQPESEESQTTAKDVRSFSVSTSSNVVEAAASGASDAIALVTNIAANLIAFISLLAFVNAVLTWFGHRAGIQDPDLTFQLICSYLLWPFAFVMGVPHSDCRKVAELIGIKTSTNEFVAYMELSKIIDNTRALNDYKEQYGSSYWTKHGGDVFLEMTNRTLQGGVMQAKSIVISTYALCGFANIGSIGCSVAALGSMAPQRQADIASMVVRAMIVGNVVSFMSACTAGLLFDPAEFATSNSTNLGV